MSESKSNQVFPSLPPGDQNKHNSISLIPLCEHTYPDLD
jgi:hypothetical protein